jgi:Ca2+-binding RTX toxin-like protein
MVTEALNEGHDFVYSSATWVMGANVEFLTMVDAANINGTGNALDNFIDGNAGNNVIDGGAGNDQLNGEGGDDTLIGGAGNDLLRGSDGVDTMIGGAGDDYYYVGPGDKPVVEASSGGDDTVETTTGWRLEANVENLILAAGVSGSNHLVGNSLNNFIQGNEFGNVMIGGAGDDTLDGRGGGDFMTGGAGNDTYVIDNPNDKIFELAGAAEGSADKIITTIFYQLPDNVENIQLAGANDITAYGNGLNNVMTGNRQGLRQGLGQSGEAYLVGEDFLLRSDSRFLLQDKTDYLREIAASHLAPTVVARIDRLNTSVLLESVKTAQGLAEAYLRELATDSKVRHFARDEFVVCEGDLGEIQEARRKATLQAKRSASDSFQGNGIVK